MTDYYGQRVADMIERARQVFVAGASDQEVKSELINPVLDGLTVPQLRAVWVTMNGEPLPRGWSKTSVVGAVRAKIMGQLAEEARTARRMARLDQRLDTVQAANQAGRVYTVVLAADRNQRVQSMTVTLTAGSAEQAARYVASKWDGVLEHLHLASVHEALPHELSQKNSLSYTVPQEER